MASPRKPKKALIMFLIAAVVAGALCIVGVGATFWIVQSTNSNSAVAQQKAQEEAQKAKEELERVKKSVANTPPPQAPEEREVQALIDIEPGTLIKENMIASTKVKTESLTPGAYSEEFEVIGKVATFPLKTGDAITKAKIAEKEAGPFVKEGMRAISIQVDPVGIVSGAVTPGAYVDILTSIPAGEKKITKTILQNVQVIAVGGVSAPPADGKAAPPASASNGSITLSVTPAQAEMLVVANTEGKFHLTLRNDKDTQIAAVTGSNLNQLLNGPIKPGKPRNLPNAPKFPIGNGGSEILFSDTPGGGLPFPSGPAPRTNKFTMTIYKGSKADTTDFDI